MLAVWELELDVLRELDQAVQNHFGAQVEAVGAPHRLESSSGTAVADQNGGMRQLATACCLAKDLAYH